MTVREINITTGEATERECTQEELDAIQAAQAEIPPEQPAVDPLDKLKSFLAANPDVAALLA